MTGGALDGPRRKSPEACPASPGKPVSQLGSSTVMNIWIRFSLMVVGLAAWIAGGAALAILRNRTRITEHHDAGLTAVVGALLGVGAVCSMAASGFIAIPAFGGVSVWTAYVVTAQRLGVFRLERPRAPEPTMESQRPRA